MALHLALGWLMSANVDFTDDRIHRPPAHQQIVQATVIDSAAVAKEVERLKAAEAKQRRDKQRELDRAQAKARELASKRRAEEKRIKELQVEKKRLTKERAAAKKKDQLSKAAALKRKTAVAAAEKAAAERQRVAALEQARQREAAAQAAERKRIEQVLQDELAAEDRARLTAAKADADAREIDRYVAAIADRVRQSFTILPGHEGLSCTLRITLVPGGEVAGVQIVKSSGNDPFDRQAENAVRKASPLPVPSAPRLFKQMRSIAFVFDPKY